MSAGQSAYLLLVITMFVMFMGALLFVSLWSRKKSGDEAQHGASTTRTFAAYRKAA